MARRASSLLNVAPLRTSFSALPRGQLGSSRSSLLRASSATFGCPLPLPTAWLAARSLATATPVKRKRTTTSELVDYLTGEEKTEALIAHQQTTQAVERKEHLTLWLKKFGYQLQDIDPMGNEVILTKQDPNFKITLKLDMDSRRLVDVEKAEDEEGEGEGEGEGEDEGEEETAKAEEGTEEGEDKEGEKEEEGMDEPPYFEEKDFELWLENKRGEVMVINGDLLQTGLELWSVAVYPSAEAAGDRMGRPASRFDVRKVDQNGYEKWKIFLRGFGIEDEFVLVSDVLAEMFDEKCYTRWLQKSKEFLVA